MASFCPRHAPTDTHYAVNPAARRPTSGVHCEEEVADAAMPSLSALELLAEALGAEAI